VSACQSCHEREAVVHLTEIVAGQVTTVHLCGRCAAERGIATDAEAAATPLGSFLAAMSPTAAMPPLPSAEAATCPACGASLADIRSSGRLGCATCWSTFERPLRDLVRRLHGGTRHVGEAYEDPAGVGDLEALRARHERTRLRDALRDAVAEEDFERAAELRDRLRAMEGDG